MFLIDKSNSINYEVLEETVKTLRSQSTKLASRRIYLQALVAKRDRLDYEISVLKKRIQEDRKTTNFKGKTLKEAVSEQLETFNQEREKVTWMASPRESQLLREINLQLQSVEKEEELIRIINNLPRIED